MKQAPRPFTSNRRPRKFPCFTRILVLTFCVGLPLLLQLSLYSSLSSLSSTSRTLHVDHHSVFDSVTPTDWDIRLGNTTATAIVEAHPIPTYAIPHDNQKTSKNHLLQGLPEWIQTFIRWHQEQRFKFPGNKLFTHPAAPKLLIRTCYTKCGGLHDRLGKLPWDLYLMPSKRRSTPCNVVRRCYCHRPAAPATATGRNPFTSIPTRKILLATFPAS
jgi:hypothetical protein